MARKMILQNVRGSYVFLKQPHSSGLIEESFRVCMITLTS